jgi:capsular exopolysaccharide synthesis family protein
LNSQSRQDGKSGRSLYAHGTASESAADRNHVAGSRNEITISELWQTVVRRKVVFLSCFAAAVLLSLLYSLLVPARYEGVGRLTVDFDSSDSLGAEALARVTSVDAATKLQTQVNVLETDALAWDVITRLRLDQRPETAIRKFLFGPVDCQSSPTQAVSQISPECRRKLIDEFHDRLRVQPLSRTEIIEIRYRCRSRELAATVVNTLADLYVERSFQTKYQAAMRASSWLSGQLDEVKRDAEAAEAKYIAYQKHTGIIGTDENHNILVERLFAVNQQLVSAKADRLVHEARNRIAQEGDPEAIATIVPGSTLQVLHTEEVQLRTQLAQLDAKFGENYPRVIQVKQQLQQAEQATAAELARTRQRVNSEYQSAVYSEALLRGEFDRQKDEAYNTNEAAIQVALLKRDVDASNELYEQLVKKLKEAGILAGMQANKVTMIDPASIPVKHVEPARLKNLVWGMIGGSVAGLALCFLLDSVDTRISTLKDVTDFCPLPALGVVPRLTASNRLRLGSTAPSVNDGMNKITTLERPESETSDAYRSLRTSLLLSNPGAPPKVILVTSSFPREGKTTTSVNTAVVFSQKNRRVLLVDGDLRRGDLRRYFNLPGSGGLSSALIGEDPSRFYVPHPTLPNLMILPAGARPPQPPDLLDSDRMRQLTERWRVEFDQVIIDAPPVIGLADAVILSTMSDTVVLVVRAHQSRRQDVNRATEILRAVDANVIGIIINDLDTRGLGYYGDDASSYNHYFNEQEGKA